MILDGNEVTNHWPTTALRASSETRTRVRLLGRQPPCLSAMLAHRTMLPLTGTPTSCGSKIWNRTRRSHAHPPFLEPAAGDDPARTRYKSVLSPRRTGTESWSRESNAPRTSIPRMTPHQRKPARMSGDGQNRTGIYCLQGSSPPVGRRPHSQIRKESNPLPRTWKPCCTLCSDLWRLVRGSNPSHSVDSGAATPVASRGSMPPGRESNPSQTPLGGESRDSPPGPGVGVDGGSRTQLPRFHRAPSLPNEYIHHNNLAMPGEVSLHPAVRGGTPPPGFELALRRGDRIRTCDNEHPKLVHYQTVRLPEKRVRVRRPRWSHRERWLAPACRISSAEHVVSVAGIEPATPSSPTKCATDAPHADGLGGGSRTHSTCSRNTCAATNTSPRYVYRRCTASGSDRALHVFSVALPPG